jgi:hypothetical protein
MLSAKEPAQDKPVNPMICSRRARSVSISCPFYINMLLSRVVQPLPGFAKDE